MPTIIDVLRARASRAMARADELARSLSDSRSGTFDEHLELEAAIDDLDRYSRMVGTVGEVVVRSEPRTYRPDGGPSFFADVVASLRDGDPDARTRLARHGAEMRDAGLVESRDVGSSALSGLVPPAYLVELAAPAVNAGAPLAEMIRRPLPDEGMQVVISRMTGAASVAAQDGEATAVSNTDQTSSALTVPVRTIAGRVAASAQLFERANAGVDAGIMVDLATAHAAEVERQLVNGTGSNGQVTGLLTQAGTTAVTYTDADPTALELVSKIGAAATVSAASRKLPPTVAVMHSRRWYWLATRSDAAAVAQVHTTRPAGAPPQVVGSVAGVWVVLDDTIPTGLGGGTNEDRVIVARHDDLVLLESTPTVLVDRNNRAGGLGADLVLASYVAFTAGRYPGGVAIIAGTGLVNPGLS